MDWQAEIEVELNFRASLTCMLARFARGAAVVCQPSDVCVEATSQ